MLHGKAEDLRAQAQAQGHAAREHHLTAALLDGHTETTKQQLHGARQDFARVQAVAHHLESIMRSRAQVHEWQSELATVSDGLHTAQIKLAECSAECGSLHIARHELTERAKQAEAAAAIDDVQKNLAQAQHLSNQLDMALSRCSAAQSAVAEHAALQSGLQYLITNAQADLDDVNLLLRQMTAEADMMQAVSAAEARLMGVSRSQDLAAKKKDLERAKRAALRQSAQTLRLSARGLRTDGLHVQAAALQRQASDASAGLHSLQPSSAGQGMGSKESLVEASQYAELEAKRQSLHQLQDLRKHIQHSIFLKVQAQGTSGAAVAAREAQLQVRSCSGLGVLA